MALDYQVIIESLETERDPLAAYVTKLIRQRESEMEEQLVHLKARMEDLESKVDELLDS